MARLILTYPLPTPATAIPFGPDDRVLAVATQHGVPTLWVEHGPDQTGGERTVVGRPDGDEVQDGEVYLGTAHDVQGGLVFHLYMCPEG